MLRSRPPSPEFRREAVELVRSNGRTPKQVARDLGVSEQSLRNWAKQAEIDAGASDGLTSGEREELGRLRREVRVPAEERDILKKPRPSSRRRARPVRCFRSSPRRGPSTPSRRCAGCSASLAPGLPRVGAQGAV